MLRCLWVWFQVCGLRLLTPQAKPQQGVKRGSENPRSTPFSRHFRTIARCTNEAGAAMAATTRRKEFHDPIGGDHGRAQSVALASEEGGRRSEESRNLSSLLANLQRTMGNAITVRLARQVAYRAARSFAFTILECRRDLGLGQPWPYTFSRCWVVREVRVVLSL